MLRLQPSQIIISEADIYDLKQRLHQRRILRALALREAEAQGVGKVDRRYVHGGKNRVNNDAWGMGKGKSKERIYGQQDEMVTPRSPVDSVISENAHEQSRDKHQRKLADLTSDDRYLGIDGASSYRSGVSRVASSKIVATCSTGPPSDGDLDGSEEQSDSSSESRTFSTADSGYADLDSSFQSVAESSREMSSGDTTDDDGESNEAEVSTPRPVRQFKQPATSSASAHGREVDEADRVATWTTELPLHHITTPPRRQPRRRVSFELTEALLSLGSHEQSNVPSSTGLPFPFANDANRETQVMGLRSDTRAVDSRSERETTANFEDLDELHGNQTVLIRRLHLPEVQTLVASQTRPSQLEFPVAPGARPRSGGWARAPTTATRRRLINAEQENEDGMEEFEQERLLWHARRLRSGNNNEAAERTPPGQGRLERFLWE